MSRRKAPPAQQELAVELDQDVLAALAVFDAEVAERRTERLAATPGRAVALDCETAGKTLCWSCALDGPDHCLEVHLPAEVHDACVTEARRLAAARAGAPCHDCAFLRDSHEHGQEGLIAQLARQRVPFHCHQGMPLDGRGRSQRRATTPRTTTRATRCAQAGPWLGRTTWRGSGPPAPCCGCGGRCTADARSRPGMSGCCASSVWSPSASVAARSATRSSAGSPGWTCARRALRAELTIAQQRLVVRGFQILGEVHRRELGGIAEHRIKARAPGVHEPGAPQLATSWIPGAPTAARDAFAVVLYRAGCRAVTRGGPDKPLPPYTRPPKGPRPPRPKSRRPPRPLPKPLILMAA